MELTEDSILNYLDVDKYDAWIKQEKKDSKTLVDFGNSLKKGSKNK